MNLDRAYLRLVSTALVVMLLIACGTTQANPTLAPLPKTPAGGEGTAPTPDGTADQSVAEELASSALAELNALNYDRALTLAREAVLVTRNADGSVTPQAEAALREVLLTALWSDGVQSAAWSPDGARIATTHANGARRLWDAQTGQLVPGAQVSPGDWHSDDSVHQAKSSWPDSSTLVIQDAGSDQPLYMLNDPKVPDVIPNPGGVRFVVSSPDGSRVITVGSDNAAHVWDVGSGAHLASLGDTSYLFFGYVAQDATLKYPDGSLISTPVPDNVQSGDIEYLLTLSQYLPPTLSEDTSSPGTIIFLPVSQ